MKHYDHDDWSEGEERHWIPSAIIKALLYLAFVIMGLIPPRRK